MKVARLDGDDLAVGLVDARFVEGEFLVGGGVGDIAIFTEVRDTFSAVETCYLMRGHHDGAVFLDEVAAAGIQSGGDGIIEEGARQLREDLGIVNIRYRLARRSPCDRPGALGSNGRREDHEPEQQGGDESIGSNHAAASTEGEVHACYCARAAGSTQGMSPRLDENVRVQKGSGKIERKGLRRPSRLLI